MGMEVDSYIERCSEVINRGDNLESDELAKEVIVAFTPSIPHISSYRGMTMSSHGPHTINDLVKLRGKLRVYRDEQDLAQYGSTGCATLTADIHELQKTLEEWTSINEVDEIFELIDDARANEIKDYVVGLSGYCGEELREQNVKLQIKKRIRKLEAYRDQQLYPQSSAAPSVNVIQNTNNAVSISVVLSQTIDNINNLPDKSLSTQEKTELKKMLNELSGANRKEVSKKSSRILAWLSDKGVDVVLATLPYIVQLLQQLG